jgi:hypothetical protein
MAAKPNTVELRPIQAVEADPEPETISVNTVAAAPAEGVTIALQPQLSPVLEVKAGVPKPPKWPNPAEALQAAFNWMFGEPAYAAREGLVRGGVLSEIVSQPNREPGIRPAIKGEALEGSFTKGSEDWARRLRRELLKKDLTVGCPSEEEGPDSKGGFWVPGVFRPNFNTTFKYTAYTGDSRPSTLRFEDKNDNGQPDPGEIRDRDPLFAEKNPANPNNNPNKLLVQPQMALNPYAWVNEGDTQNYSPSSNYRGGYYIDTKGSEDIRNGLCFYVRVGSDSGTKRVQIQIDRNGSTMTDSDFPSDTAAFAWVDVEPFTLDLNKAPTGFAGENPVLGVILDEVTRRPIPIPRFQSWPQPM